MSSQDYSGHQLDHATRPRSLLAMYTSSRCKHQPCGILGILVTCMIRIYRTPHLVPGYYGPVVARIELGPVQLSAHLSVSNRRPWQVSSRSPIPDSHKVEEGSCPAANALLVGVRKCYVLWSYENINIAPPSVVQITQSLQGRVLYQVADQDSHQNGLIDHGMFKRHIQSLMNRIFLPQILRRKSSKLGYKVP